MPELPKPMTLSDVSPDEWAALARRQVFFGHQSVGANILAGFSDLLARHPQIRVSLVESKQLDAAQPALRHALVGRNGNALSKIDETVAIARQFGAGEAVVMVKLCYVDAHMTTDPAALFADYQRRMASLREAHPRLTIVHCTMPLTDVENWKGRIRARLTGTPLQRDRNRIRHRYNELMRAACAASGEPLFDVALLESTLPDGRRAVYRHGGEDVPMLAAAYTHDGGHLNEAARGRIAEQLLVLLARLPRPGARA